MRTSSVYKGLYAWATQRAIYLCMSNCDFQRELIQNVTNVVEGLMGQHKMQ
jgi:hypothetical protein